MKGDLMKVYVALFKKDEYERKSFTLYGNQMQQFKNVFPDYKQHLLNFDGGIVFLKGKINNSQPCFSFTPNKVEVNDSYINIEFDSLTKLDINSGKINNELYKFAQQSEWITEENKFYPNLCLVNDDEFDKIRKGTFQKIKIASNSAKIEELKSKNNWLGICKLYEPLENIEQNNAWNNPYELYQLAFACSKAGELQNGKERDIKHLSYIKRYRDLAIKLYKRCYELDNNSKYSSAVAYRHYQNFTELNKPKGRKDGNKHDEYKEAVHWYDISLKLFPTSIKDNYRKAKLTSKYLDIYRYNQQGEWTKERFETIEEMGKVIEKCYSIAIEEYKKIDEGSDKKGYYRNEYVKALYNLGAYYFDKQKVLDKYDYAISIFNKTEIPKIVTPQDEENINKAYKLFKDCISAETDIDIGKQYNYNELLIMTKKWAIAPSDKYYRMGLVFLYIYYMRKIKGLNDDLTSNYGRRAERYLTEAKRIATDMAKNYKHIKEKLAWYYIFSGNYNQAITLTEKLEDSYVVNTYATALMLSKNPDNLLKAEEALKKASKDKNSKVMSTTNLLLDNLLKLEENVNED
jgi:hypothetical protein